MHIPSDVIAALIALVATVASSTLGLLVYGVKLLIKTHAATEQVNDSVNHRHLQPKGTPRLYDAIIELHQHSHRMDEKTDELLEWKRTYDGGPLDGGAKVLAFVESVEDLKTQVQKLEHHCKKKDCSDGCNE